MSMHMVKHGIISFGHILNDSEKLSFQDFAERISEVYDLNNRQTLFIYNLFVRLDGTITKQGEEIIFNYKLAKGV